MKIRKPKLLLVFLSLACVFTLLCFTNIENQTFRKFISIDYYAEPAGQELNLQQSAPPDTDDLSAQPDFDIFAWNTFIALNWPAYNAESPTYLRGIPDLKNADRSFINAKNDDVGVWETFKEKREVFNHPVNGPGAWNGPPNYGKPRLSEDDIDNGIPGIRTRTFAQSKKMMTAHFNSFDETAEVGSEALEPFYPDGRTPNPILGRPVGPRVWRGMPKDSTPVLYEVKVNYDFFKYVEKNDLYIDNTAPNNPIAEKAKEPGIFLPYRTSAAGGPKGQNYSDLTVNYSEDKTDATYKSIINQVPQGSKPSDYGKLPTPPTIGSIHLKAAWIQLDPEKDDLSKYHIAEAQYFDSDSEEKLDSFVGTFGLIGLHIIQRIHKQGANGKADPTGGTFIFATWEHNSVDTALFTYSNFYNPDQDPGCIPPTLGCPTDSLGEPLKEGFYPPLNTPFTVKREFPIISNNNKSALGTAEVNKMFHDLLRAQNPNSVWLNYQLIGTQFIATNPEIVNLDQEVGIKPRYPVNQYDPKGIGQPQYLANLVIETNHGLQFFKGQPPGVQTIPNYNGAGVPINNTVFYQRDNPNTTFNRVPVNMGGCMGCHGVAQSNGYAFSFVLLGGFKDATIGTETHFGIPPLQENPGIGTVKPKKLKKLRN